MTKPPYWDEAKTALARQDKTLRRIIASYDGETLILRGDAFFTLARSIAGQQISVKAADSVWNRLTATVGRVAPEVIRAADTGALRACGLSASKVSYLHGLADHFLAHEALIRQWPEMGDDDIMRELTSIKGIGRWTAEMFLIFHLGRPDVFPLADIGLQKAIFRHYNNDSRLPVDAIRAHGERWRPWRTVATWYLWRALDPVPVAY